jgi:hypothetical protein
MAEIKSERITLEDLPQRRQALAWLREEKGKSREALKEADLIEGRFHEEVVDIIWEHYLIGKHMIMEAREKNGLVELPARVMKSAEGYLLMRSSALKAQEYIDRYDVAAKRPRSGRFLGEVEMLIGNHKKAAEYFGKSVSLFSKMDDPSDRVNALELSGFWAEALILGGKAKDGVEIATQTFKAYDQGDGLELKNRDYYTWAVWKSGCAIKAWHALFQKGISPEGKDRETLVEMLKGSGEIVNVPPTWGDFSLRRDEITSIMISLRL